MGRRLKLQTLLENLKGDRNVYFQPPSNLQMQYPAIVYALDGDYTNHANNNLYFRRKRYQVTVIDRDPDTPLEEKMAKLPRCRLNRVYASDNLNHFVYTIYF